MENKKITPLAKQYYQIKNRFQDCILMFQLGDFYEMWDEDARLVSETIGLTLTNRGENPMCGIPVHNLDFYLKKIVFLIKKPVAICVQKNTPEESKKNGEKLVERDVEKIITRGNYNDPMSIDNSFLMAINHSDKSGFFDICYVDFSSNECFRTEVSDNLLISEVYKINPVEIIINDKIEKISVQLIQFEEIITEIKEKAINALDLIKKYTEHYKIDFTFEDIKNLNYNNFVKIGSNVIENLDIANKEHCLLKILDKTQTPEGKRLLKSQLLRPLRDSFIIKERLDEIEEFISYLRKNAKIKFPSGDLRKLIHNIQSNSLNQIKNLYKIGVILNEYIDISHKIKANKLDNQITVHKEILKSINPEIENLGSGCFFINNENIKKIYEKKQQILSDIFNLPNKYGLQCKVKTNSLIGYFFEFTKIVTLPSGWILKQGLSSASRYTNSELLDLESKLKQIELDIIEAEKIEFLKIKNLIYIERKFIDELLELIGKLDYYQSCAINAIENKYYRPIFTEEKILHIENGRHPIIEKTQRIFIDNNLKMNDDNTTLLVTGPNMGGKSTFLRQNALIIWMAQVGMFVPANVEMHIFDGIFVRIGAGDNIMKQQSTFMVEMLECKEILDNSTEKSFIILDEIGRGTSTKDGIAIAQSIIEYLHDRIRCFSIISTHYQELTMLEKELSRMRNCQTSMAIENDKITFFYKIIEGFNNNSFGIYVASLANLPQAVITRAKNLIK